MNLPNGEKLILTIDRVLPERKCEKCDGRGYYYVGNADGGDGPWDCLVCKRTGRRTVRLRGWVEMRTSRRGFVWQENLGGIAADCTRYDMADRIATAYLVGTLPPEIAANIEEDA